MCNLAAPIHKYIHILPHIHIGTCSQQVVAKEREEQINRSREAYRRAASEASMLYFVLTRLRSVNPMYQYSLDSFITFVHKVSSRCRCLRTTANVESLR